ncbi:tetratricopeptide repeat protein [Luteimonas kalidii]|uniref:Tetratricopeptide repeat protein n=1 Tax=Luteimonas kalidii TaxID=3042025 RepID=A0ABT6JSS6_9GAMM|nr:tetratricopeptide repeat protein [Luteimonas kalidii]MDH5833520.1 tetratricopeptide repeat protein [Luteimonas kalidii]
MVTGALVVYAVLVLAALAVAAAIALPLRKASPRVFAAIVVVVPVLAFALYRIVGTPAALDGSAAPATAASGEAPSMEEAIAELQAALARDPAQPEGWRLLARAQASLGNREAARDAYMSALEHIPDDPELLLEAAQARAQAAPGNRFDDEALAMLRQALAIEPDNQRAAWFVGVVQRQRGEDAAAVATWEALLPKVDASTATALRTQIDQAREAAGMPPLPADANASPVEAATAEAPVADARVAPGSLRVRVTLADGLAERARLSPDAVVFVIARAAGGPPMPVAVERHAVRDLPLDIVLDDSDSPMPTAKLSSLEEVEVLARISATGSANRSVGDLESAPVRVRLPAITPVALDIAP